MHTKDFLAQELRKAGLAKMADKAVTGYYHDYLSPLPDGAMQLERDLREVITKLGMPIGGESKPVAIALLVKSYLIRMIKADKTEGEKLRIQAVMLCKDDGFQRFCLDSYDYVLMNQHNNEPSFEGACTFVIYRECGIGSRSELATNIEAQNKFKQMLVKYKQWRIERDYKDNLERV